MEYLVRNSVLQWLNFRLLKILLLFRCSVKNPFRLPTDLRDLSLRDAGDALVEEVEDVPHDVVPDAREDENGHLVAAARRALFGEGGEDAAEERTVRGEHEAVALDRLVLALDHEVDVLAVAPVGLKILERKMTALIYTYKLRRKEYR